jgi:hypothetical protein
MVREYQEEASRNLEGLSKQFDKEQNILWPQKEDCLMIADEIPEGCEWPSRYPGGLIDWARREDAWPKKRLNKDLKKYSEYMEGAL